jgi:lipoate-protein ligase B
VCISADLRNFDLIVPCGLAQKKATSLEKILGCALAVEDVKPRLVANFAKIFRREMRAMARPDWEVAMKANEASAADAEQRPTLASGVKVDVARSGRI